MRILGFVMLAAAGMTGCASNSGLDSEIAGRTLVYSPGIPNFDMEAIATLRGDETGIDLYVGIPYASLVFLSRGDEFVANYEAYVQLRGRDGKNVFSQIEWADTVIVKEYGRTQVYKHMSIERRFPAEPGEYIVHAVVTDLNTDEIAERRQRLIVVGREETGFALSRLRIEAKEKDRPFGPIVSYHMPSRLDSLRSVVELYNAPRGEDVIIEMSLISYPTDTTVAQPPYWLTPSLGSLRYRGVDFSSPDTLQKTRRELSDVDQDIVLEFAFPTLVRGAYRINIEARLARADPLLGQSVLLRRRRNLSIKGEDFPHITRLSQLINALEYIAINDELEEIRESDQVEERRMEFDGFWGGLVNNRQAARNLIQLYYNRVEEANLLFTGHKEGWKTDRGMVYMILGPPMYVEQVFDAQIWHYSYAEQDFVNAYHFKRVRPFGAEADFDHYILTRRPFYERSWTRAVERWRSGQPGG